MRLATLRADPTQRVSRSAARCSTAAVRLATPIIMGEACVNCHNSHPESPKKDWKVGDVRGIQEVTVQQPVEANLFAFKYLFAYLVFAAIAAIAFIVWQFRQSRSVARLNRELHLTNDFLATVSLKIAKYLSPQIYKSIFSGEKDTTITTERKKLTIFFSDIVEFTATTERLQPEELTGLLNEYLTEMSDVALQHGGTVDKFIGDAILVFFGDPETRGVVEDARAAVRMAVAMQDRLAELSERWMRRGIEKPFRARMGINTGYCNVGNFGSADRMDYTIIGAEANLAARLQQVAGIGQIVMSYETYALVSDMVVAKRLPPITMKGISREIMPYVVEAIVSERGAHARDPGAAGRGQPLPRSEPDRPQGHRADQGHARGGRSSRPRSGLRRGRRRSRSKIDKLPRNSRGAHKGLFLILKNTWASGAACPSRRLHWLRNYLERIP